VNTKELIRLALEEDIRHGDITTDGLGLADRLVIADLLAKESGILAGINIFCETFFCLDENVRIELFCKDGEWLESGKVIARLQGQASSILKAERVALNFLQRLSGIATQTNRMVKEIGAYPAKLLDTRKTTPLMRELEKYAVRSGGGYNHRFGLYDMIMLKENHILSAGSIRRAVELVRQHDVCHKVEVEVTNLKELAEAVECGIDRVMLDNMSLPEMREAVMLYHGRIELEASGNVNLETIAGIAATGVDFISSGSMTHSYKSMDISLIFEEVIENA
jgi:nicotinate-nucleotide pyrophosphorylase (carboxylating)